MAVVKLKRTVVLVGLMGAGKTSVGKRLSEMLSVPFVDSDEEIEAAAGMSIPEIFSKFGEEEFRRGESAVLSRLAADEPSILSTGGGAFTREENRNVIKEFAVSVWLNVDLDVLWSRVQDKPGRPLLETPNPYETLKSLFDERLPMYQLADVCVRSKIDHTQEDVAKSILKSLLEFDKRNPERVVLEVRKSDV